MMKCRTCGQKIKLCEVRQALCHIIEDGSYDLILDVDHDAVEDTDILDRQERSNETKGTAK